MLQFIIRRILYTIPTVLLITIVSFLIIELPPGDYLTSYVAQLEQRGEQISDADLVALKQRYGLGQPVYVRYLKWMGGVIHGDFGQSFEWNKPVSDLIVDRLALTAAIALLSTLFIWVVALPIGVYSATHQYSIGDYIFTFFGFIGVGVPDFLLALVILWLVWDNFGINVGGLYPQAMEGQPWNWAKISEVLKRIWVPMIILGVGGTAGMIRTMRANMLDELRQPYVVTARAKGLKERKLLWKYPVKIALNPFMSTVGWMLPGLISGATIVSIVLSLPTNGPILLKALMSQDMYLAASFLLLLSVMTVIGTLISDILLVLVDPRIRYTSAGSK